MKFEAIVDAAIAMLKRRRRVSSRMLKRQFNLDDTVLADLKAEILETQLLATEVDGDLLVWDDSIEADRASAARDAGAGAPGPAATSFTPEAERRQLTVMFGDLVGSTPLSSQLDPEDLREVILAYQEMAAGVIRRFDGYIAQYLGDGLLVYFGYPRAHENEVQRAVYTGLGIVDAMQVLNARLQQEQGIQLAVRIGIHTGPVVVGEMGSGNRQENLALGETPNIAARLQGVAPPNTVVISEASRRLIDADFSCTPLGEHVLNGLSQPIPVYQVLGERAVISPLEPARLRALTPLVGRAPELQLLLGQWARVKAGHGQVVQVEGEAGIGKSRLIQALKRLVGVDPHWWLESRCSPYHPNTAFYPLIDLTHRSLHWQPEDTTAVRLQKLEQGLATFRLPLDDTVPVYAALLSLPLPEGRYQPLPPERQRPLIFATLTTIMLEMAAHRPILFVVEDLHWADPSTLDFIEYLIEQISTAPIMVVLTCRPTVLGLTSSCPHLTLLTLQRLSPVEVEQLVLGLVDKKGLPPEIVQYIVEKADGVALFVEECTKAILESSLLCDAGEQYELIGPLSTLSIPATLQDLLMARLDRLESAKSVAQLGAVIGRRFSYDLLAAISPLDDVLLKRELQRLVSAQLLYQRDTLPDGTYLFKHALIQDIAYQSLLKRTRQEIHQQIAQTLAEAFPEVAAVQPELLAYHYHEAGLLEPAIECWLRAGTQAMGHSAHAEAIGHLTQGLAVLAELADSAERAQKELLLLLALSVPLMSTKGWAAQEVEQVYLRVQELRPQVDEPQLFRRVLSGLWSFHVIRGDLHIARDLAEQYLNIEACRESPQLLAAGCAMLGSNLWLLGEITASHNALQYIVTHEDAAPRRPPPSHAVEDSGVAGLAFSALALWHLGYAERALQQSQSAIARARALAHPFSLNFALGVASLGYVLWGEYPLAHERIEEQLELAHHHGFRVWASIGTILQGRLLAERGEVEGIAQMEQGLARYLATGTMIWQPYYLAQVAEAQGCHGRFTEGMDCLRKALKLSDATGERWYTAELYRLQGEFLLCSDTDGEPPAGLTPEACFHNALDVARQQHAQSLELRAAMSLSRWWRSQGLPGQARTLLTPIYLGFSEGFDTPDLRAAQTLLTELGG